MKPSLPTLLLEELKNLTKNQPGLFSRRGSSWLQYGLVLVLMGIALLLRLGIAPISAGIQYVTFFPAVALAAIIGGHRAGLLATVLGLLAATYIFTPPYYSFSWEAIQTSAWSNLIFLCDGIIVSLAIEAMHMYRERYVDELAQLERTKKELENSNTCFRALFEQLPDPAWIIHNEHFVDANAAALAAIGYTDKPDFLNLHPVDISPEYQTDGQGSAEKAAKEFEIVSKNGTHRFTWTHKRIDNSLLPVEVTLTSILWNGERALYCVWRDISEQKLAEDNLTQANLLLTSIVDNIPAMVFLKRASDLRFELFNHAGEKILGYKAHQLLGRNADDFFPQEQTQFFSLGDQQVLMSDETVEFPESAVTTAKGETRYLLTRKTALRDASGQPTHLLGVAIDITERKRAEEEMHIAAVTFDTDAAIMINDADGNIRRVNRAFQKITGYSADEVIGQNPRILSSGKHDKDFYAHLWRQLLDSGSWAGEIWDRRKNGEVYPKWLTITAIKNTDSQTTGYVAIFSDISEQKHAEDEIRNLAFYDPLTKLPNRRLLMDRFGQAILISERTRQYGAVLFLDMDKFKTINDTLGHDYGDLMLIEVAKRISFVVRQVDTVARLGGDEFVVLIEELGISAMDATEKVIPIAEKVRAALAVPYQIKDHVYHSSPSIGVSLYVGSAVSVNDVLKCADIAMYQAKNAGRDTVRFYDPAMQHAVETRAALEADLRKALQLRQLELYYQIQIDENNQPLGAEALIRWQHPQRGMVPPSQFIPIAEESSLILELGQWILDAACQQLAQWQQNETTRNLILAINVSAKQFRQTDFVASVERAILVHKIDVNRLKLELTESVIVDDVTSVVAKMHALKALGIRLSLDDFGTGYSSLSYLKQLPLDQLKIDQSFVRDVVSDPSDAVLVKTIIDMARNFRLNVIAEGVESKAQLQYLKHNGCMAFQGYLFSKPIPIDQFNNLLQHHLETN